MNRGSFNFPVPFNEITDPFNKLPKKVSHADVEPKMRELKILGRDRKKPAAAGPARQRTPKIKTPRTASADVLPSLTNRPTTKASRVPASSNSQVAKLAKPGQGVTPRTRAKAQAVYDSAPKPKKPTFAEDLSRTRDVLSTLPKERKKPRARSEQKKPSIGMMLAKNAVKVLGKSFEAIHDAYSNAKVF